MVCVIYTDGAAKGNPGPGGYGTVVLSTTAEDQLKTEEFSGGYRCTTNNRMELMAVIVGLEHSNPELDTVIYSDSKYVVDAFRNHWIESWQKRGWRKADGTSVKNIDLWIRLLNALSTRKYVFEWVKGHNGDQLNERCDYLATSAAVSNNLLEDKGFTM